MTTGSRNPQCVKKWSRCVNGDDRILELSPEDTRRSAVQIRTTPLNAKILNVLIRMETDGLSDYSVTRTRKILTHLSQNTDLNQPQQVKKYVADHKVTDATKKHTVYAYDKYAKYYNIQWTKPKYKPKSKAVRVPTKEKVETLVNSARQPLCLKLRISAETGMRPVEIFNLKVKDTDLDKGLFYPTTAKNGNPRNLARARPERKEMN